MGEREMVSGFQDAGGCDGCAFEREGLMGAGEEFFDKGETT